MPHLSHRDVKGPNLLVHGEGQLVLVDFGVATYEGAPTATGPFPPRHLALPQPPGVALLARWGQAVRGEVRGRAGGGGGEVGGRETVGSGPEK